MRFFSAFLLFSLSAAVQSFEDNLFSAEDDFSEEVFSEMDDEIGLPSGKYLRRQLQDEGLPSIAQAADTVCATCECISETRLENVRQNAKVFKDRRVITESNIQFQIERFAKKMADANTLYDVCQNFAAPEQLDRCIGNFVSTLALGPKQLQPNKTCFFERRGLADRTENRAQLADAELASSVESASSLDSPSQRQLRGDSQTCRDNDTKRLDEKQDLKNAKWAWKKLQANLEADRDALECQVRKIRHVHFKCKELHGGSKKNEKVKQAREECIGASIREDGLLGN